MGTTPKNKAIDAEYLLNQLKNLDKDILETKYVQEKDIKDTYTATDENPISGKGVSAVVNTLQQDINGKSNIGHKHTKSEITDFPTSMTPTAHTHDDRYYTESEIDTKLNSKLNTSLKGSANGLAELDSNGKVLSSQLPSFVDDVIEGYLSGGKFYKESAHTTEIIGETGKIYIDLITNKTYRWSGSTFVVVSETLALGETSSTAYRGDRGKIAYEHSQSTHARTDATKVEKSSTNGNIKINGTETTVYTHPSGTNPHGTTKSDVGLGNVPNVATNDQTPTYTQASSLENLTSGEKVSVSFGKIMKAIANLISHLADTTSHITSTERTNWNNKTSNVGTITGIKMNGASKGTSGVVDLGTVITAHQDISGKVDKTASGVSEAINKLDIGTSNPTDSDYYVCQYAGGGTTNTGYFRRPMSALWNYIKSKLATVATSGSYNDLSNKPTIPTVGNGTVTIKQAGTSKGTFTMNQTGDTTIELTDNNTTYSSKSAASGGTDVSLVTTGEKYIWNNKANASHGNHVPATQTANNAVFLRNDNTWQTVTPANIGAAASNHTHDKIVIGNSDPGVTGGLWYE